MEEDNIFYGGIRFPQIKAKLPTIKLPASLKKAAKKISSAFETKKIRQTGKVSAKKAAISKVESQKAATAKFEASKADSVKARELQAKRVSMDDLEAKFENPMFREKIAKSVEAKQGAFGKKLSPDELRGKVDAEMKTIKQNAEIKAKKLAAEAKQKISKANNAVTISSKVTLSGKISKLKADFLNRINGIRNRGVTPGSKLDMDNPVRMGSDGVDAKSKSANAADANTKAKSDTQSFRDGSSKADASAKRIDEPKPKGPDGPTRGPDDGPTRGPDGGPDGGPNRGPDGGPDGGPNRGPDGPTRGPDGPTRGPDGGPNGPTRGPDGGPDGGPNRGPDGGPDGGPNRGPDGPNRGPDGPNRGPDGGPTKTPDGPDRAKGDTAKNKASNSLDAARGLVGKIKKALKGVLGLLGQVLMIGLPIALNNLPRAISRQRTPPSLPPPTFNIRPPPPPIISPEGTDIYSPVYTPTGTSDPTSGQPPEGAESSEEEQEKKEEGEEEGYDESFGNIVFQLTEQPTETISFQISSLSDSLEFDENTVTFPLENWSAPVYLNFISTLETSPEEIVDDIRENVSEKLKKLKQEKRVDKRPNISIGSLDDYSAKNDEINARKKRLEYMLKPAETIQEALAKINKRVRMRQSLVEPTYDGGYSEYRGIVEPTYDTKIIEEQVEPTYDESEYKILEDKVYPSEKIIKEEIYEPIEEIVEPIHDDSEYKDYIDPTLDGGQEEEEEEEEQEEESIEEDILPELDYDTIVSRIDETELSDKYKAEIEFILLEEITSEVNIVVSVLDPTWTLKPNMISFDNETSSASSFFFSEEIYKKLQNLYAEQYANQVEDKFDDYIEEEYETGMNSISEQEEKNRIKEDEVYDDVYDKVYQQELSKIEDSEYILEQLGGYTKPTVSNLFKRTRKLPRVVKK